jgi:hypothetical protein
MFAFTLFKSFCADVTKIMDVFGTLELFRMKNKSTIFKKDKTHMYTSFKLNCKLDAHMPHQSPELFWPSKFACTSIYL